MACSRVMAYQILFEVITVCSLQVVILQNFRRSMDSSILRLVRVILSRTEKLVIHKALPLDYRTTPLERLIGLSPAELLINRRLKSIHHVKKSLLMAENAEEIMWALEKQIMVQKTIYDKRWCSKELPPIKTGQKVECRKMTNGFQPLWPVNTISLGPMWSSSMTCRHVKMIYLILGSVPSTNLEDTSNEVVRTRYARTIVPPTW